MKGGANTPPPQPPQAPSTGNNTPKQNNKSNNKSGSPPVATAFNIIPVIFNTMVKLLPFGLYLGTIVESVLFNDIRGFIVFIGLILNDFLNIAYNYLLEKQDNERCAVVRNMYSEDFLVLPTTHTEYISFVGAFLTTSMYFKKIFNYGTFMLFVVLIGLTMFMRVSIGCKDFLDAFYALSLGLFKGIIYYIIVKDFYEPADVTPEDHWLEEALKKYFPISDEDDEFL